MDFGSSMQIADTFEERQFRRCNGRDIESVIGRNTQLGGNIMKIENSALPESGYIEKVIDVEKLESGNYQVTARAFPTRKRKVQIITMEFSRNGFNALLGSLMALVQEQGEE